MGAGGKRARLLRRDLDGDRNPARLGRRELDVGPGVDGRAGQAFDVDVEPLRLLGRVHQLQPVDVLDPAVLDHSRQRAAVADDVGLERRARRQAQTNADEIASRMAP